MSIAALFSLIFATLVGLLPVFLLVGRRVMANRVRGTRNRKTDTDADLKEPTVRRARGTFAAETADASPAATGLRVSGSADPAGDSALLDRLIRERRETGSGTNEARRMRAAEREALVRAELYDAARIAGGIPGRTQRSSRAAIEARLARLTTLQRAVVFREILGPPAAERGPGGLETW